MTTAHLPHGHSPARARRGACALLSLLLAAAALPAMATTTTAIESVAAAPAAIASPDTAADTPRTSEKVKSALQRAFSLLGTPYRWGGTSPDTGFDCSGLVGYVFRTIGIDLPRVSREMVGAGTPVKDRNALAEGDLVFFGRNGSRIDHVGIYVGDGKFLHAPRTGRDVTVSSLTTGYWAQKYMQARRVATGS